MDFITALLFLTVIISTIIIWIKIIINIANLFRKKFIYEIVCKGISGENNFVFVLSNSIFLLISKKIA